MLHATAVSTRSISLQVAATCCTQQPSRLAAFLYKLLQHVARNSRQHSQHFSTSCCNMLHATAVSTRSISLQVAATCCCANSRQHSQHFSTSCCNMLHATAVSTRSISLLVAATCCAQQPSALAAFLYKLLQHVARNSRQHSQHFSTSCCNMLHATAVSTRSISLQVAATCCTQQPSALAAFLYKLLQHVARNSRQHSQHFSTSCCNMLRATAVSTRSISLLVAATCCTQQPSALAAFLYKLLQHVARNSRQHSQHFSTSCCNMLHATAVSTRSISLHVAATCCCNMLHAKASSTRSISLLVAATCCTQQPSALAAFLYKLLQHVARNSRQHSQHFSTSCCNIVARNSRQHSQHFSTSCCNMLHATAVSTRSISLLVAATCCTQQPSALAAFLYKLLQHVARNSRQHSQHFSTSCCNMLHATAVSTRSISLQVAATCCTQQPSALAAFPYKLLQHVARNSRQHSQHFSTSCCNMLHATAVSTRSISLLVAATCCTQQPSALAAFLY